MFLIAFASKKNSSKLQMLCFEYHLQLLLSCMFHNIVQTLYCCLVIHQNVFESHLQYAPLEALNLPIRQVKMKKRLTPSVKSITFTSI